MTQESIQSGTTRPQLVSHPIHDENDFHIYEYMLEDSEFIPRFDAYHHRANQPGDSGYLVPMLNRVPFQSLLIDAMGEVPFFYALYDFPKWVNRLLRCIDQQIVDLLEKLSDFETPYIEFCDNLEGSMANPRLFQKYLIPSHQRYSEILHHQGKKLGSPIPMAT